MRSINDIRETGAGWIAEQEVQWLCDEIERLKGWLKHIDGTDWDRGEAQAALRGDPAPT